MLRNLLFTFLFVAMASTALCQVTAQLPYQGKLYNRWGQPLQGFKQLTFRLYNVETGGTALWTEVHNSVELTGGAFSVRLGLTTSLATVAFDEQYWIGIEVASDGEMVPRFRMAAAPYSMAAVNGPQGPQGPEGLAGTAVGDFKIAGDLYLGSGANDPVPPGSLYTTLWIRDDEPSIHFLDTSNSASFPRHDWAIQCNDNFSGGENYFALHNLDTARTPFRIDGGAPTYSFTIDSAGNVGLGTRAPTAKLHVTRPAATATIKLQSSASTAFFEASVASVDFGSATNHPLRLQTNNTTRMTLNTNGTITMADGGSYTGTWNNACSRKLKENIRPLTIEDAEVALAELKPVRYVYKKSPEDERVGFIAEDVPELVAMPERKNISTLDIVAVLTRVVQEQEKDINGQAKAIEAIEARLSQLEALR